jgi:hypothetical protein
VITSDLPILTPTVASVLASNERHLARIHPAGRPIFRAFVAMQAAVGEPVAIVQSRRSDRTQRKYFAQGRTCVNGVWRVVDKDAVVTKSPTAADTAHGCVCRLRELDDATCICAMAIDLAFLIDGRLVGPRPGPGNDSWDGDLDWHGLAVRARDAYALTPGAGFGESRPGALDGWDKGHFELRGWKALKKPLVAA